VIVDDLSFIVAMAGTVAFATSAVLAVAERKVDLFAGSIACMIVIFAIWPAAIRRGLQVQCRQLKPFVCKPGGIPV
jgi:hypothetical protein